jgi:hypothetical protein
MLFKHSLFITHGIWDLVHPVSKTRLGGNTDGCRLTSEQRTTYVKNPLLAGYLDFS